MRSVKVIGIGTGGLDQLTLAAVRALGEVDRFLVADKGGETAELVRLRTELISRYAPKAEVVLVPDPPRDRSAERPGADGAGYLGHVAEWHAARARAYAARLAPANPAGESGTTGFLVWGDPAFYDSTLRIVDRIRGLGYDFELEVIPGISAPQALAVAHQIALNRIGSPVHITTGRRLRSEWSMELGDVVVMLDGHLTCRELVGRGLEIFWGAYLGSPDQVLRSGALDEVIDELVSLRAGLRAEHGWVMDTYLLRPLG
ncbi:precorrin-6A synthase (deacetylating) [Naumannella sp. ID2617S]|nr:precorrin-6A synthase (deacetylating) [Naumannella sp. ID2617S]